MKVGYRAFNEYKRLSVENLVESFAGWHLLLQILEAVRGNLPYTPRANHAILVWLCIYEKKLVYFTKIVKKRRGIWEGFPFQILLSFSTILLPYYPGYGYYDDDYSLF